jgi:uncharacterized membrane protein
MNTLLKLFALVHVSKLYPDTAKSMLDGAFKIVMLIFIVWATVISFIVFFGLKVLNIW